MPIIIIVTIYLRCCNSPSVVMTPQSGNSSIESVFENEV